MNRREIFALALTAAAGMAIYLLFSITAGHIGFPLDDAWIHQTYARNLILTGRWEFQPGAGSGGSTSPLWTLLLAPGQVFRALPVVVWPWLLGLVILIGLGWLFNLQTARLGLAKGFSLLAGLFAVCEWHFVWAALSGMETLLAVAATIAVMVMVNAPRPKYGLAGVVVGLAVWIRPELITLAGPIGLVLLFESLPRAEKVKQIIAAMLPILLMGGVYLGFNLATSGEIWPTTFFAKQAEYAVLLEAPLIERILRLAVLPLSGAGVLLLPGFVAALFQAVRQRKIAQVGAGVWWAGMILIYSLRLPVVYQHGRYMMPVMAVYFLLGLQGTFALISYLSEKGRWMKLLATAWTGSIAAVQVAFLLMGGASFSRDVEIIQTEMVDVAQWLEKNTQPDALLAVHDIGAVGYFSQRRIVDLAGLVNPEVIPFIRDDSRLREYLNTVGADYLVVFPTWYDHLTEGLLPVYTSAGHLSLELGEENLTVYKLTPP